MTAGTFNAPQPPPGRAGPVQAAAAWLESGAFSHLAIERMAHSCQHGLEAAWSHVDQWRREGHDLEDIYIHAIAPCARLLGQWWCDDAADFAQVTIASSNLQRLLHCLSEEFCAPGADRPAGLSLLLATEPQAQHTMGAFMLAEFFRRRGWRVQLLNPQDGQEVLNQLGRDWFDAVGLSVSTTRQLQAMGTLVPCLRLASPNPGLRVLLGGPLVNAHPEVLEPLEVDLLGGDARETVNQFGRLFQPKKLTI